MKLLIVGGDGMLGHQLLRSLAEQHETKVTLRRPVRDYSPTLFSEANSFGDVDVTKPARLMEVVEDFRPEAVINCVGVLKHAANSGLEVQSVEVNAAFPHRLLDMCERIGARLVHISTDCVFSGAKGSYIESDPPDPLDLYGTTKQLGEITNSPGLTIRTSIIGLELSRFTGLVEWFLAQHAPVKGFRRAIFSGVTTIELARVAHLILTAHPQMSGLWHIASEPISKYELLLQFGQRLENSATVMPTDTPVCDRSLRADRFTAATGYVAPPWPIMLDELAHDVRHRRPMLQADA